MILHYTSRKLQQIIKTPLNPYILTFLFLFISSLLYAQPAYDVAIAKPVAMAPYKIWQKDQLYAFGGMANVNNLGTQGFQNPKLKLEIFNSNSNLLWADSMNYVGSNVPMPGKYFPSKTPGQYTGNYTVTQDVADFNPLDNVANFTFSVDNQIMSKEDIGKLGVAMCPDTDNNYTWGNIYHITKNISEEGNPLLCEKVQIGIGNAVELAQDQASIFVYLYKWDNANLDNIVDEPERTTIGFSQYEFVAGDQNNELFTFPIYDFITFNIGAPLEENTTYILAVQFQTPNPLIQCKILADPDLNYSLNTIKDSLSQNIIYGSHVLDVGNTNTMDVTTLNGNAVPVIRMLLGVYDYISGKVYLDLDCDHVFNNNDKPIVNKNIIETGFNWPVAVTDQFGDYHIPLVDFGSYSFSIASTPNALITPPTQEIYYNTPGQNFIDKDFSVCFITNAHELAVDLSAYSPPRPGFVVYYDVCVNNLGLFQENAKLTFDFNGGIADGYTEINYASGGTINGHTVTWEINNIDYFQNVCKTVEVYVLPSTPIGTVFNPHAKVEAESGVIEVSLLNNEIDFQQPVVGSFDPNDKAVNKTSFSEKDLKEGVDLEYFIRFQNTGNYPATFIEVLDTIQNTLDMEHFEMLAASHEFTLTIINGNILKWRFDNINLPDSTSNEPGSHGYIKFHIKTKENLTKKDVISNSAAIYFDYNLPVFTNTAKTEFVTPTFNVLPEKKIDIVAFPNPTVEKVNLQFSLPEKIDYRIEIRDVSGKLITSSSFNGISKGLNEALIDLSLYSSGVYLVSIKSDNLNGEVKVVRR